MDDLTRLGLISHMEQQLCEMKYVMYHAQQYDMGKALEDAQRVALDIIAGVAQDMRNGL